MVASKLVRPIISSMRKCHHSGAVAKTGGQTPHSFIHDGYANARFPFFVHKKWSLAAKITIFLATGFWAPFAVVEYHLRKANK
uniref:Cytochrome c oxidase polypeptide VIIc n=1 Tax=Strongyloides papillosus TaxID=174720 RepID=A0A0N5BW27_STREA